MTVTRMAHTGALSPCLSARLMRRPKTKLQKRQLRGWNTWVCLVLVTVTVAYCSTFDTSTKKRSLKRDSTRMCPACLVFATGCMLDAWTKTKPFASMTHPRCLILVTAPTLEAWKQHKAPKKTKMTHSETSSTAHRVQHSRTLPNISRKQRDGSFSAPHSGKSVEVTPLHLG